MVCSWCWYCRYCWYCCCCTPASPSPAPPPPPPWEKDMKLDTMSMGTGKMMVELCSAEMLFRVWRYRS